MPLRRPITGEPQIEIDALCFPMEDSKGGAVVVCKVSYDYLRRRDAAEGVESGKTARQIFDAYREDIEKIANAKYRRSKREAPFVTAADL